MQQPQRYVRHEGGVFVDVPHRTLSCHVPQRIYSGAPRSCVAETCPTNPPPTAGAHPLCPHAACVSAQASPSAPPPPPAPHAPLGHRECQGMPFPRCAQGRTASPWTELWRIPQADVSWEGGHTWRAMLGAWEWRHPQGGVRREGASEAAGQAAGQAVGGGCQSGRGRLLSVTNAIEAGTWRQGDSG